MSSNVAENLDLSGELSRAATILLVEDETDYARLVRESIEDPRDPCLLNVVENGEDAISYLSGQDRYADRSKYPFPFLLLLDLKMAGTGGYGVLRWLVTHPDIKNQLKVVVLSSVQSKTDIEVVYELGAQFFWPKSEGLALREKVRFLKETWSKLN